MAQNATDRFGKRHVPVMLTGEEWFALLARIAGRGLSAEGATIYNRAAGKLQEQILAASESSLKTQSLPPIATMCREVKRAAKTKAKELDEAFLKRADARALQGGATCTDADEWRDIVQEAARLTCRITDYED
jgi:hypothetical protein